MHIKKISGQQSPSSEQKPGIQRPSRFSGFVGQDHCKKILTAAIQSSQKGQTTLGHILLCGPSGYGKTTLAQIIAHERDAKFHMITGYAINKPADIMSIMTTLTADDVLFIDEIHRLKPVIEEMLYIAMEDHAIDMVMPDGGHVRLPLKPFTLIGATTKPESMSTPLKNRFVYTFHFHDYTPSEKSQIITHYLSLHHIQTSASVIDLISQRVDSVPRDIANFCIKIRDYLTAHDLPLILDDMTRQQCAQWLAIDEQGLTAMHHQYLDILRDADRPLGVNHIAIAMGMHAQTIEHDLEPLLIKRGKIQKTPQGRVLV